MCYPVTKWRWIIWKNYIGRIEQHLPMISLAEAQLHSFLCKWLSFSLRVRFDSIRHICEFICLNVIPFHPAQAPENQLVKKVGGFSSSSLHFCDLFLKGQMLMCYKNRYINRLTGTWKLLKWLKRITIIHKEVWHMEVWHFLQILYMIHMLPITYMWNFLL